MKNHRVPSSPCPVCGKKLDAMTGAGHDHAPSSGDVTICLDCRTILIWEHKRLRLPNDAEMHEIAGNPRILEAMRVIEIAKGCEQ